MAQERRPACLDGIVARRLGVATAGLRRFDSATDACFYLALTWAAWRVHPEALRSHAWSLAALLALEIAVLFGSGQTWGIPAAIAVGIYCDLKGLAASLVLPTWTHDVPSIVHAWRIRHA